MKFSIIIPCYNRDKFISKSIRSALNQINIPREELEVIVVDDCSTDKSVEKIQDFIPSIKFIKNKKNYGISASRNIGIKKSKGKYLLMLDSDDYISNNYLEIMGFYLDNNKFWDAVACDYIKVTDGGKVIRRFNCKKSPIACGILYRKNIFPRLKYYDVKIKIDEDKDFKKRFLQKKYKMGYIELPLYRYVMHKNNITKKKK